MLSTIDRRTRAGRVMRTIERELTQHMGGAPSVAEALLIQSAALKATRLALLSDRLLDGDEACSDQNALAWLNSMRLDLQALGLSPRIRDVTPTLEAIVAKHATTGEAQ